MSEVAVLHPDEYIPRVLTASLLPEQYDMCLDGLSAEEIDWRAYGNAGGGPYEAMRRLSMSGIPSFNETGRQLLRQFTETANPQEYYNGPDGFVLFSAIRVSPGLQWFVEAVKPERRFFTPEMVAGSSGLAAQGVAVERTTDITGDYPVERWKFFMPDNDDAGEVVMSKSTRGPSETTSEYASTDPGATTEPYLAVDYYAEYSGGDQAPHPEGAVALIPRLCAHSQPYKNTKSETAERILASLGYGQLYIPQRLVFTAQDKGTMKSVGFGDSGTPQLAVSSVPPRINIDLPPEYYAAYEAWNASAEGRAYYEQLRTLQAEVSAADHVQQNSVPHEVMYGNLDELKPRGLLEAQRWATMTLEESDAVRAVTNLALSKLVRFSGNYTESQGPFGDDNISAVRFMDGTVHNILTGKTVPYRRVEVDSRENNRNQIITVNLQTGKRKVAQRH